MLPLDSVQKQHFGPSTVVLSTPPTRSTQRKISKRLPVMYLYTIQMARQVFVKFSQEAAVAHTRNRHLNPHVGPFRALSFFQQGDGHPILFGILRMPQHDCSNDWNIMWQHVASRALRYSVISSSLATNRVTRSLGTPSLTVPNWDRHNSGCQTNQTKRHDLQCKKGGPW